VVQAHLSVALALGLDETGMVAKAEGVLKTSACLSGGAGVRAQEGPCYWTFWSCKTAPA